MEEGGFHLPIKTPKKASISSLNSKDLETYTEECIYFS
jgi:hypothetical protein